MRLLCRRLGHVTIAAAALGLSLCIVAPPAVVHAAAPPGASAYVPVSPYRILDTRVGTGFSRRVNAGETFTLALTAVPVGASAVVLNVTITAPATGGFVTVYPSGVARPTASSINVDTAGQTIANLVTVPVGASGTVDVFSQLQTDLVADVQGYYMPAPAGAAEGRFEPVNPTRLLDTREPASPRFGALGLVEQITVDIAGLAGLPTDMVAAALKVTVTESTASGFWTVFPAGTTRPTASNLNADGAGETIANQVLAPLSGGQATVFSQSGGHLVIDLVGWFTGPGEQPNDVGLFVPVTPARLLDSREEPLGARPGRNRTAEVAVANRFGVPPTGVGAVVVNATITEAAGSGFFSLWPARTYRPTASSLNAMRPGQTIANHVITPVTTAGFSFYTQNGGHLVADIAGWYTGTEQVPVLPPHVPLIGVDGPPPNPSYGFSDVSAAGPARWNPCQAIRYVVNLGGYDPSFRRTITEAVERLEAATGLPLVPAGDTTFMPTDAESSLISPFDGAFRRGAFEIEIALSDERQTDLLPGSVVGKAATESIVSRRAIAISTASVVIDMGDVGGRSEWSSVGVGPVLLHELAHAVGLGHVEDTTQLMNPFASQSGPNTYSAGDLTGLWQLGAVGGCVTL
jgi:hypothetical protein